MPWRPSDQALLSRLEDEILVERLFQCASGASGRPGAGPRLVPHLHPRAAGLIAEVRRAPGGAGVVAAALQPSGDVAEVGRFLDGLALKEAAPELLHHLALFHAKVASALEGTGPEAAADAWVRSFAAWLALGEEGSYLARLEEAVLGNARVEGSPARHGGERGIPGRERSPRSVDALPTGPLDLLSEIARRADASARDLTESGRAALLALSRTDEAARLAGASPETARRAKAFGQRRRNAAIEAALSVIAEGLDEANVRGELASSGRVLLLRAIPVWTWTSNDEAVEQFVVDRVDKIGWELYRAKSWDALRYLLDPFRPMFDSLGRRIEGDPTRIAYAAGCAQMFVFLAEVERGLDAKLDSAERSVRICPTHRNGRLVLAAALVDQALGIMRPLAVFAPKKDVERVEALLARAESLYPETSTLPDAKRMLARIKGGRIAS